ncbi:MAG: helix-turn-helix domain-containing protein [Clostridia bacterium]|nr:helix-turn-helix domain-containing protein [Clostridia bacterium]
MSKAADMLINTSKSIGEVAEATGFNQLSYFGKCFKDKMKCSPKEYKNEHK